MKETQNVSFLFKNCDLKPAQNETSSKSLDVQKYVLKDSFSYACSNTGVPGAPHKLQITTEGGIKCKISRLDLSHEEDPGA